MICHAYYTVSEVRIADVDVPEPLTDMKEVYRHVMTEIAKDPKAGKVVERNNIVPPETLVSLNGLECDGVFLGF